MTMVKSINNRRQEKKTDRRKYAHTEKTTRTVETLFRNALKSNLELTSLADTKASILISVNGFILTVIITASGFQMSDSGMVYAFSTILFTAITSITFAVLAIRPRFKKHLLKKDLHHNYESVLYFQDMALMAPEDYVVNVHQVISNKGLTQNHIIKHLHMLGAEINLKYKWLRLAYASFAAGLIVSAVIVTASMYKNNDSTSTNSVEIVNPL